MKLLKNINKYIQNIQIYCAGASKWNSRDIQQIQLSIANARFTIKTLVNFRWGSSNTKIFFLQAHGMAKMVSKLPKPPNMAIRRHLLLQYNMMKSKSLLFEKSLHNSCPNTQLSWIRISIEERTVKNYSCICVIT